MNSKVKKADLTEEASTTATQTVAMTEGQPTSDLPVLEQLTNKNTGSTYAVFATGPNGIKFSFKMDKPYSKYNCLRMEFRLRIGDSDELGQGFYKHIQANYGNLSHGSSNHYDYMSFNGRVEVPFGTNSQETIREVAYSPLIPAMFEFISDVFKEVSFACTATQFSQMLEQGIITMMGDWAHDPAPLPSHSYVLHPLISNRPDEKFPPASSYKPSSDIGLGEPPNHDSAEDSDFDDDSDDDSDY